MAAKSDFAQKLLHDLKLRKERMQTSNRDSRGNVAQTYKDARKIQALESKASSRTGSTSSKKSNGNSRSINPEASSNQIVLYDRGSSKNSSSQVKDLSMAIAFAFENNGNLSKIGVHSSNPLVNFFSRFSRRSRDSSKKMELMNLVNDKNSVTTYEFSNVSHIHINEITKGIQKLNQILKACSAGKHLDKNSIEVGKELLKGAMDLEESLKMLANLQEGSNHTNQGKQSSRIRLIEEEEEGDQEDSRKKLEIKHIDRPRFSFDKPSSRAKNKPNQNLLMLPYYEDTPKRDSGNDSNEVVTHKRSWSCVPDFKAASSPSHSEKDKGKISNVIAKLMGLEELPTKEDVKNTKRDLSSESKENNTSMKKSGESIIKPEIMALKSAEKSEKRPQRNSNTTDLERNRVLEVQNKNSIEKKQISVERRERNMADTGESNVRSLNVSMGQENNVLADAKVKDDIVKKKNNVEKRKVATDVARNQQIIHDKLASNQVPLLKKPKGSYDKNDNAKQKVKQSPQKHNLMERSHKENKIESAKINQGSQNLHNKKNPDKITPESGKLVKKPGEEIALKDPDKEISERQDQNPISEHSGGNNDKGNNDVPLENHVDDLIVIKKKANSVGIQKIENHVDGLSAATTRAISKEIQKIENPRKMDVLLTRRNGATNHSTRSSKQSAQMLQDLKQRMSKKSINTKRTKQQSQSQDNIGEVDIVTKSDSVEEVRDIIQQQNAMHKEAEETTLTNDSVRDASQTENTGNEIESNDEHDDMPSDNGVHSYDLQSLDQQCATKDERELKQHGHQNNALEGDHNQSIITNKTNHEHKQLSTASWRQQDPLTESEKEFKEVIIKDQLFLNTAEALFKLNLPITFLPPHHDQSNESFSDKKLILDCGYEVMKRKAMTHENTLHPLKRNGINHYYKVRSLDDLVKQLCENFETIKLYGGDRNDEQDIANCLYEMLDKDICGKHHDVSCMWDYEWNRMKTLFSEMEDVVRDVEKQMLNSLLDELLMILCL